MNKPSFKILLTLFGILLLSSLVRAPGLFWGYNLFSDGKHYVLAPDERYHAGIADEFFSQINYEQFYVRGMGTQIAGIFGLGRLVFDSLQVNSKYFYAIGRLLALIYGLATVFLIYFFANELFDNETVSILSSLFLGLCWIHTAYSHLSVPDVPALFWMYLSFYFVLKYLRCANDRDLFGACIGAGFSMGTKPSVILLAPLALIVINSPKKIYHILLISFSLLGAFAFINFLYYTPQSFLNSQHMVQTDSFSGVAMNKFINIPVYLLLLLPSVGLPVFLLFIWGVFKLFAKSKLSGLSIKQLLANKYVVIFLPMLLHFYFICKIVVNMTRYLMPIIPTMLALAAYGAVQLSKRFPSRRFFNLFIGIIIIYQLTQIISLEKATVSDSRSLMGDWLRENVDKNKLIAIGPSINYNLIPSEYKTTKSFDADYIIMHSCFYSRYLTGGYDFKDSYPDSCDKVFHCWGGEPAREFIQDLFKGKTGYKVLKKYELGVVTPEMLLTKYLFGPRVDGYGAYTGDTIVWGKKAG